MKLLEQTKGLDFPAPLPSTVLHVKQTFNSAKVEDITAATMDAADKLIAQMKPGATVAVGVGSRGIANIPQIVRATVDRLKSAGMKPFVIPTMGSHGGATAEGQLEVLENLGVTPDSIGVEFKATMECKQIGQVVDGPPLYQDANAHAADHSNKWAQLMSDAGDR